MTVADLEVFLGGSEVDKFAHAHVVSQCIGNILGAPECNQGTCDCTKGDPHYGHLHSLGTFYVGRPLRMDASFAGYSLNDVLQKHILTPRNYQTDRSKFF